MPSASSAIVDRAIRDVDRDADRAGPATPALARCERLGDHVQRQGPDQRRSLDVRDELRGREQASLGMVAPDERLDAGAPSPLARSSTGW